MALFRDIFSNGNGIFATVFKSEYPTQYDVIFGDCDPVKLDNFSMLLYGDRTVISSVTETTYKDIVNSVICVFVDGWKKQADAMRAEYDVTNPTSTDRQRTETITSEESADGSHVGADIAFNDQEFSDKEKTTNQDTKNRTESHTVTEKITGVGSKSITDEVSKEMNLRKMPWVADIIHSLVDAITLSVY